MDAGVSDRLIVNSIAGCPGRDFPRHACPSKFLVMASFWRILEKEAV